MPRLQSIRFKLLYIWIGIQVLSHMQTLECFIFYSINKRVKMSKATRIQTQRRSKTTQVNLYYSSSPSINWKFWGFNNLVLRKSCCSINQWGSLLHLTRTSNLFLTANTQTKKLNLSHKHIRIHETDPKTCGSKLTSVSEVTIFKEGVSTPLCVFWSDSLVSPLSLLYLLQPCLFSKINI